MVYRSLPGNDRLTQLEALFDTEPEVRRQRARIAREQDVAIERVDQLGVELAAAERSLQSRGIARLWRSQAGREREVARLREELRAATARADGLVAQECELTAQLAAITAGRTELAALESSGIATLRAAPGRAGDEVRALHAALAADTERIEPLATALDICEHVRIALAMIDELVPLIKAVEPIRRPFDPREDIHSLRQRLRVAIAYARQQLCTVLPAFDALRAVWPGGALLPSCSWVQPLLDSGADEPIEWSSFVKQARATIDPVMQSIVQLESERQRRVRLRDERGAALRAIAMRVLRGAMS